MEMYIIWVIGWFFIVMWGAWLLQGYPVYAILKTQKIELRKKEIELELLKIKDSGRIPDKESHHE